MGDFQVPEQLKLSDKLYSCRQHKKVLEGRLDKHTHQYRCIPQKREIASREVSFGLIPASLFSVLVLVALIVLIWCFIVTAQGGTAGNKVVGIAMLLAFPVVSLGGYSCFRLWKAVIMAKCNLISLDSQEESLCVKMGNLNEEIAALDREIAWLERKLEGVKQMS